MDKQHNYQIVPSWRLVHCRKLLGCLKNNPAKFLPWNLSLRTPLLQGQLNLGEKICFRKNVYIILASVTSIKETSLLKEKGHLSWG